MNEIYVLVRMKNKKIPIARDLIENEKPPIDGGFYYFFLAAFLGAAFFAAFLGAAFFTAFLAAFFGAAFFAAFFAMIFVF
jgi:hypothetical protein